MAEDAPPPPRRSLFLDPEHPAWGEGERTHIYCLAHVRRHASCLASTILFLAQDKAAGVRGHQRL